MREKTNGKEIVRPGATRFATAYLSLKSLYTLKDPLKALFVCDIWTTSKLAKTNAGKKHMTLCSLLNSGTQLKIGLELQPHCLLC